MSLWWHGGQVPQKQEIQIIHQMLLLQTAIRLRLWKIWEWFLLASLPTEWQLKPNAAVTLMVHLQSWLHRPPNPLSLWVSSTHSHIPQTIKTDAYYAWPFSIYKNPAAISSPPLTVCLLVWRPELMLRVRVCLSSTVTCISPSRTSGPARALRSHPLERHDRAPVFGNGCAGSDKQFKEESALM